MTGADDIIKEQTAGDGVSARAWPRNREWRIDPDDIIKDQTAGDGVSVRAWPRNREWRIDPVDIIKEQTSGNVGKGAAGESKGY